MCVCVCTAAARRLGSRRDWRHVRGRQQQVPTDGLRLRKVRIRSHLCVGAWTTVTAGKLLGVCLSVREIVCRHCVCPVWEPDSLCLQRPNLVCACAICQVGWNFSSSFTPRSPYSSRQQGFAVFWTWVKQKRGYFRSLCTTHCAHSAGQKMRENVSMKPALSRSRKKWDCYKLHNTKEWPDCVIPPPQYRNVQRIHVPVWLRCCLRRHVVGELVQWVKVYECILTRLQ